MVSDSFRILPAAPANPPIIVPTPGANNVPIKAPAPPPAKPLPASLAGSINNCLSFSDQFLNASEPKVSLIISPIRPNPSLHIESKRLRANLPNLPNEAVPSA